MIPFAKSVIIIGISSVSFGIIALAVGVKFGLLLIVTGISNIWLAIESER